jgi:hypothetical protein
MDRCPGSGSGSAAGARSSHRATAAGFGKLKMRRARELGSYPLVNCVSVPLDSTTKGRSCDARKVLVCKQFRLVLLTEWTYSERVLFLRRVAVVETGAASNTGRYRDRFSSDRAGRHQRGVGKSGRTRRRRPRVRCGTPRSRSHRSPPVVAVADGPAPPRH